MKLRKVFRRIMVVIGVGLIIFSAVNIALMFSCLPVMKMLTTKLCWFYCMGWRRKVAYQSRHPLWVGTLALAGTSPLYRGEKASNHYILCCIIILVRPFSAVQPMKMSQSRYGSKWLVDEQALNTEKELVEIYP